jgi:hypothetical protein
VSEIAWILSVTARDQADYHVMQKHNVICHMFNSILQNIKHTRYKSSQFIYAFIYVHMSVVADSGVNCNSGWENNFDEQNYIAECHSLHRDLNKAFTLPNRIHSLSGNKYQE